MLTLADREEPSQGLAKSLQYKEVTARISRDASVVSREVNRRGGREGCRALAAERAAGLLRAGWSPASITGRLARDHDGEDAVRVGHEAVYQWVYAQPVTTLNRELIALRTGRTARRGPRPAPAPRIREPRYLDERPAEAEGRAVAGHWEGDLVIGKGGRSAVATLVERASRFLVLLRGSDSLAVTDAIIAAVGGLPSSVKRSLTWDCGSEMALHKQVTATGLPVFFAHPHSPWERGSNENLNRIVRKFLPKGVDIPSDPRYLAAIAAEINDRPRK